MGFWGKILELKKTFRTERHSFGNDALPNDALRDDVLAFPLCTFHHIPFLQHLLVVATRYVEPNLSSLFALTLMLGTVSLNNARFSVQEWEPFFS
jgi:hypothetical protein